MRKKRYVYRLYRILGLSFGLFLLIGLGLLLCFPNADYSEKEKRYLSDVPNADLKSITDGRFMDQAEAYAKDRFPLRDAFVSLKVNLDRLFLKKESQGVYYLEGDALAERFIMPEKPVVEATASAIKAFSERTSVPGRYFLLAPTAVSVLKDRLPAHALTDDQDAYMDALFDALPSQMKAVDVRPLFRAAEEDTRLYYLSDHHWTTEGAYLAAGKLLAAMGITELPAYESGVVCSTFAGSLAAKSGFTLPYYDSITVYKAEDSDVIYTVTYEKEHRMRPTVYEPEALSGADPYEVFFGGNYPEITITTSVVTDRKLLVLKDSYANALVPFLIPHFKQIKIIDPRYAYDDIDVIVQEGAYTDLLFLYNATTLSEDTSLVMFLKGDMPGPEDPEPSVPTDPAPQSTETEPAKESTLPSSAEPEDTTAGPEESSETTTAEPETTPETPQGLRLEDAVFVGDSRTVFMGSQTLYGVTGSGVMDDSRLFATFGGTLADPSAQDNAYRAGLTKAPVCFFWYGVNDVQIMPDRNDAIAFVNRYRTMVDAFLAEDPEARVIILSVAGTSVQEHDYYEGQEENIVRYNEALSAYAAESGFNYIDVTPLVSEDAFLPDHIHFTDAFYQRLMPYLQEQLTALTTP